MPHYLQLWSKDSRLSIMMKMLCDDKPRGFSWYLLLFTPFTHVFLHFRKCKQCMCVWSESAFSWCWKMATPDEEVFKIISNPEQHGKYVCAICCKGKQSQCIKWCFYMFHILLSAEFWFLLALLFPPLHWHPPLPSLPWVE